VIPKNEDQEKKIRARLDRAFMFQAVDEKDK